MNQKKSSLFWDKVAPFYEDMTGLSLEFGHETVSRILKLTGIMENFRVLDIGCGPGTLSIPFALKGCSVTAMDNSEIMCSIISGRITGEIADRITVINAEFGMSDEKVYNLVCAGFCPAINDFNGLMKMENCSNGFCSIVSSVKGIMQEIKNTIWTNITGEEPPVQNDAETLACLLEKNGRKIIQNGFFYPISIYQPSKNLKKILSIQLADHGFSEEKVCAEVDSFFSSNPRYSETLSFTKDVRIIIWKASQR